MQETKNAHLHVSADADQPVTNRVVAKMLLKQVPKLAESVAEQVVTDRDYQRQMLEDTRATRRNFNRMMTLMGAFVLSLIITYTLNHPGMVVSKHLCKTWGPYSFAITIACDSLFTIYALFKHY